MLDTSGIKNGLTIEVDGSPVKVIEFLHVKPGKGSAFVRSKLKNLLTGNTVEKTFRAGEGLKEANIEKLEIQYTYEEEDNYVFMNTGTFEEERVQKATVDNDADFLIEGVECVALRWNEKIIGFEVPQTMVLEVVETTPNVKGNTAQGGSKPATLSSGAIVNVPLFIEEGESIKVDTKDRKYLSRAN